MAQPEDGHRALPPATDLEQIVSIQERRVVGNDWTVRWHNQVLQLPRESSGQVRSKQRVLVSQQVDGALRVFAQDQELAWSSTLSPPPRIRKRAGPTGSSQGQRPADHHPWRQRRPASEPLADTAPI